MLRNFFKIRILFLMFIFSILFTNCDKKSYKKNQISIKVNSIERETKQARINTFDTIDVRIESFGFPKKTFPKIAEYITDSTGSVIIKIDRTKKYHLILSAPYIYGTEDIVGEELKDGQEINIEVIHLE